MTNPKRIKFASMALAVLLVALATAGMIIATHWPFSQAKITQSLQETFPATVTFHAIHSTYLPHPGCIAEGVEFRRVGRPSGTPPIATIQHLTIQAHYTDIFFRPGYLAHIIMDGVHLQVPAIGTPLDATGWHETPSTIRVGEILADGAVIEIARANPQPPLRFDVHTLKLTSVSRNEPLSYAVALHNPLPPGEIRAHGQFGPWNSDAPGQTPVAGEYIFQNADLSVFEGIAGILLGKDKFQGILQHIETRGRIDIPDFMVTQAEHPVHLTADYRAIVNGTNGDVALQDVTASYLHTTVHGKGEIAGHAGQHGKTTSLDLTVREGHIQDLLWMFVHGKKSALNGVTNLTAHVIIPPDLHPFLRQIRMSGDFGISGGEFSKASTQADVDTLSERARGLKPAEAKTSGTNSAEAKPGEVKPVEIKSADAKTSQNVSDQNLEDVISNLAGHVEVRDGIAHFRDFSFAVPGAFAKVHGVYNLENKEVNLHGTLKTEAELSEMSTGFKSVLLKPLNVVFKKKHAGAEVPVHLIGTYKNPEFGLDLPIKKSDDKAKAKSRPQPKSTAAAN
jgi:AsmA-like C-terminal region